MDWIYTCAGAFTGFIVGLTGVGGGALMTPILLLGFGINPTSAVATDLWFAIITKIAALSIHQGNQQVEWQAVRRLWLGSLPAAACIIIALLTGSLHTLSSKFLTTTIGCVILITAFGLLSKQWFNRVIGKGKPNEWIQRWQRALTISAGIIIGILVALTSVGAGVLGSIILLYLYPQNMTSNKLVGTDIAHAIPLAFVAGIGYLVGGHVNLHLLISLLSGAIPAAMIGSFINTRTTHSKLRFFLVAILSITGLKLVLT